MIPQLETAVFNQQPGFDIGHLGKDSSEQGVAPVYNLSVHDAAKQKLDSHSRIKWETDQEDAFFIGDLGEVYRQHLRWMQLLPRIEPHFGK
jgi:ornithine decarboxylase